MARNITTEVAQVIVDFIKEWNDAVDNVHVRKPISFALYRTWIKWDNKEKDKEVE